MTNFLDLEVKNTFSKELPADKNKENYIRQVYEACFSFVEPKKTAEPKLIHLSNEFLKELRVSVVKEVEFLKIVTGNSTFPNAIPYAMCYAGHQFGNWAGQLGDGRAINIAELEIGAKNWKFQLKGAGPTPYSRGADGLAVLRSSIREYLCSEAMHNLGVPTTRALSLATSGDLVTRDILYNGNPKDEIGAIVCRVSPSFIRFGSFEIFAAKRDHKTLKTLVDYTIKYHYPELGEPSKETYISFFKAVADRTLEMIVHWQRVGFVHGVMNTDNMSVLGLTIDYGPYGWLENYDTSWTPNTTDASQRRYRFGNQPSISLWNLVQLGNALYPLIEDAKPLQETLDSYKLKYKSEYHKMMLRKLGLYNEEISHKLIALLTSLLEQSEVDMTLFFRKLAVDNLNFTDFWNIIKETTYSSEKRLENTKEDWEAWFTEYSTYLVDEDISFEERKTKMNKANPKYVLRNYMAQLAIEDAEKGDYNLIDELYKLIQKPYEEQPEMEKWFTKRPGWALNKVGCSMLSCSS